ncbi:MAG TPA: carboxypeptidase-like regulatory domain-containing protein [Terriglobales bacterium]|nr:carboxypeptidase-like regulatory domain-containing protein [Terriglobales bacterium]
MNSRCSITGFARFCFCACFLVLVAAIAGFAQAGRGTISGTVNDPAGAVVPGVQVTLVNRATGVTQHTVTSAAGLYTFISLNPGVYRVTASQTGFRSFVRDNVNVNVDAVTAANITLEVGAVTETVTVSGTASLIEASNSTVGSLISSETIDRVPLLYRNVYDLVQLSAGVTPPDGSPNSQDSMQSIQNISVGRPGVDVSSATINGAIVGSVYFMLDGSPIGIAENNSAAIIPAMNIPEDGVDEVRVETQNTPASYQSGAAGVISLVSKSGTNQFHGDVFGVFRPNILSANEYFNKQTELSSGLPNTPPSFYRYQEGAAIGGPIKRDKLFFFGDYEATQQQQFEGIKYYSVPTSAERIGDFSQMGFTIYDPTRPDLPNGNRQPFPGNKIPNPNPLGLLFLGMMPQCNLPNPTTCQSATTDVVNNFGLPGLDPFHAQRFDVRLDWDKSERQRIFTRFSYDRLNFATANVFPSGWDQDYAENTTNARNVIVADDLTLNPTTVLNLRYSFTRHFENQGGPASYSSTNLTNLGTVNGSTVGFPASLAAEVVYKQLPFMEFADVGGGVGGTADYNIFRYASMNSDVNAAINKVWRKHNISTGFEWMKRYLNVGQPPAPAGSYAFDITSTDQSVASSVGGSDYASMLIGMATDPDGVNPEANFYPNFTKDVFAAESNPYYAAFVEDTYHPRPTLTITAGLRWDIFGSRNERFNRQEYFNPNVSNTYLGVSYTGAEIYVNGNNRSTFITDLHNFGPRLAFAWQPVGKFVVRGGAGIYYGPSNHQVESALNNTDGFSSSTEWNGVCLNADGNTVFNGTAACTGAPAGSPPLTVGNFTGPYSLSNPFPTGVVPVFTHAPPGLANNLGITLSTVLRSQPMPTIYNYNFALEYELPHQFVVTAGYVGSRGAFLPFGGVDLNQLDLGTIAKYQAALQAPCPAPSCVPNKWAPIQPPTNANYGMPTVPLFVALEPYPQFGNGYYGAGDGVNIHGNPAGDSEYSSLQTKVQKRLTSHFTTLSTFTWGKLITDDGNPPLGFVGAHNGSVQDWKNLNYEHSVSPQDVKYQFSGSVSYDLPVGKGRGVNLEGFSNAALGGWTVNAIAYLSTGVPINTPSSGVSPSYFNQRADQTCNPSTGAPHTVAVWFTDNCFAIPGTENGGSPNPYIPGTAPNYLDHVRTRGARDLDLSIYKSFPLGETRDLRFDVSAYNLTNTPQYGYPAVNSIVGVQQQQLPFGLITNTLNTPRQFQFGARFTF